MSLPILNQIIWKIITKQCCNTWKTFTIPKKQTGQEKKLRFPNCLIETMPWSNGTGRTPFHFMIPLFPIKPNEFKLFTKLTLRNSPPRRAIGILAKYYPIRCKFYLNGLLECRIEFQSKVLHLEAPNCKDPWAIKKISIIVFGFNLISVSWAVKSDSEVRSSTTETHRNVLNFRTMEMVKLIRVFGRRLRLFHCHGSSFFPPKKNSKMVPEKIRNSKTELW